MTPLPLPPCSESSLSHHLPLFPPPWISITDAQEREEVFVLVEGCVCDVECSPDFSKEKKESLEESSQQGGNQLAAECQADSKQAENHQFIINLFFWTEIVL